MNAGALSLREVSRRTLDKRYGLFRGLGETPRARQGAELFIMGGEIVDPKYFARLDRRRQNASNQVAGAGLTREEALWCALGEGIERYSAQIGGESRPGAFAALGKIAIDPRDFLFYSSYQYENPAFAYKRFDPDTVYSWTPATDLLTGAQHLAPVQLAALGAELQEGEPLLCQAVSTGIASHSRPQAAVLSGLLEVVERDAFMATWQLRRSPPKIELCAGLPDDLDPRVSALLQHPGIEVGLYLLSTDNAIPVVLCTIHRHDPPATVVGASARLSLREAVTKAVIEAWHTWAWGLTMERKPAVSAEDITEFEQHVRCYFEPSNQKKLAFIDAGERIAWADAPDSGPKSLDGLVQRLDDLGHRAFNIDLTSDDVAELGFFVTRVLVSGMQPLACGVRHYPLEDRRLRALAEYWRMAMPAALNSDPHPFP